MERFMKLSPDKLIFELEQDMSDPTYKGYQTGRFPVRLIVTDDFEMYTQIVKLLSTSFNLLQVHLSDFCFNEDSLPNLKRAVDSISKNVKKNRSLLVTSLGEVLRIESRVYPSDSILNQIHSIETLNTSGRVLVVLFGVSSFVEEYWKKYFDPRKYPPMFIKNQMHESHSLKVKLAISEDILRLAERLSEGRVFPITGFKEYLRFYESITTVPTSEIVVYSSILTRNLKNKNFPGVEIEFLRNIKDIASSLLELNIPFDYKAEETALWERLIYELKNSQTPDVFKYLKLKFNVLEFSSTLFTNWKEYSAFEKWLLYNWTKVEVETNLRDTYIGHVLLENEEKSYKKFEELLWLTAFKLKELSLEQISERRELLTKIGSTPPKEFFESLSMISDPPTRLKLISGTSTREKYLIIDTLGEALNQGHRLEELVEIIKITYPELYSYISFNGLEIQVPNKEFIVRYFKEYIISRLKNMPSRELIELGQKFYSEDLHLDYKHRNSLLLGLDDYSLIWIDALGVEWTEFIVNYLRQHLPKASIKVMVGKASIPTTTEFNPPLREPLESFNELDQTLHSRKYPQNIVDEIEVLKEILNRILHELVNNRVIITSDHGATQFNGYTKERIQVQIEGEVKRDGRYMVIDKQLPLESLENPDYHIEQRGDKVYLVSKTYKVLKGGKLLHTETHGGATPEEILIPIILIEPQPLSREEIINSTTMRIVTPEIRLVNPIIKVNVDSPIPIDSLLIEINKNEIEGIKEAGNIWIFNLKKLRLKPGIYTGIIKSEYGTLGKVKFKVRGGLEEEFEF